MRHISGGNLVVQLRADLIQLASSFVTDERLYVLALTNLKAES